MKATGLAWTMATLTPLLPMVPLACTYCSAKTTADDKRCSNCGAPIDGDLSTMADPDRR